MLCCEVVMVFWVVAEGHDFESVVVMLLYSCKG